MCVVGALGWACENVRSPPIWDLETVLFWSSIGGTQGPGVVSRPFVSPCAFSFQGAFVPPKASSRRHHLAKREGRKKEEHAAARENTHTHFSRERPSERYTPCPPPRAWRPHFFGLGGGQTVFFPFLGNGAFLLMWGARGWSNRFLLFFPPCPQAPRPRPGCFLWFCCRIGRRP